MRKNTFIKKALIAIMFLLNIISYSQNLKPFTPRYDQDVRGDMFLIGNNILNRNTNSTEPEDAYNGNGYNSDFSMEYIDIDSDASTFSSSSANLVSPRPGGDNCYKIVYAGLYWGAILQSGSRTNINQVKLKLPTGGYNDITGEVIYDSDLTPIGGDANKPYACYADVTSLISPLANPVGTYTVANVISSEGGNGGTGLSAGWSLIIVYEDPTLTSKSIVTFDGFSGIGGATTLDIPITGFRTIPSGPVRAKFAMTALEGDQPIAGDYLRINGNTISTPERAANNFFNSSITTTTGFYTNRNPNSSNTLGYDAGIINVLNPGNAVIGNNATSATIRLGSTQDVYFYFFNAFAVDIIAPEIQLTKDVESALGVPIGGTDVTLGQQLNYEIGFQNIGNDNATSFTISDVLPVNVVFNPADLALPGALPPGVTFTFTAPRTLTFTIPNNLVEVGDPRFVISIRVHVVSTCLEMDDACSNLIQNQAFATYSGTFNTSIFSDEGSIATFGACGFGTPGSTNFLVGLDDCSFTRTEVLCGGSIVLTAADGYQTYTWSGPGTITPVAGTNNQSVTITQPGTYIVNNIINLSPCKSIFETINVVSFGNTVTNPVIPVADHIAICPNDLKELPFIFLCGAGDSQLIQTNIVDALSFSWERLVGCTVTSTNPNCANDDASCTWTPVGSAPSYTATTAGEYRIVINFQGGCQRIFFFNVFQNLLAPTVTARDIICTTPGQITVNNVPPGYLYSLTPAGSPPGTWVASNVFTVNTAGLYTVHIQQSGVVGGCIFTVPDIAIQVRNFSVTATFTQPLCFGEKGSVTLVANGVDPQYTFTINQGATVINSVGPIVSNNHTFSNLNPGNYSYTVTTQNGCTSTANFTINNPQLLTATVALTRPITCTDGEITIYPVGGTPPYSYFINSATVFQSVPQYVVSTPGLYNIHVVDANNCFVDTSITVTNNPPPVFTVSQTNVLCYGDNAGAINFNVTNANGYTLGYSITGAAPFTTNPSFTNLLPGTYTAVMQYTLAGSVCLTPPQTITITQPAVALTASGGVAAVACASNGGNGIVRITNVQGGTPYPAPNLYQYNFGAGYQNLNQANLPPGTYTIYVRDANLCEFPMTVTLDPIPPDPTITVGAPVFSCTGSASSTVTVNNGASSYSYQYFIDVPLTPPHDPNSNVFNNVPCGPHVVTVNYTLVTPSTFSNLLREDFGVGAPTTTSGINTAYCFENQSGVHPPGYTCNLDNFINDGEYGVTNRINPRFGAWNDPRDHTTNGVNPNGRFLCVNIGGTAGIGGIIYSKPIVDIIPNQDIQVSLWAMNLILPSSPTLGDPNLTIQLIANLGLPGETLVATTPVASPIIVPKSNRWEFYTLALNPGAYTSLSFVIRSYSNIINGNDVVIDDINVFQLPVSCLATRDFPINIACNQAFSAQVTGHQDVTCSGLNNGTITIAAQNFNTLNGFQVSMNNGTTWTTHMTSPVTVPVPAGYPGFVLVRFDATPGNAACTFNLPQVIITPALLTSSATFTPVTCTTGSTITATAGGGTPAYQYQLTNSVGGIIVGYNASPIFTNIPAGSYIVVVRDANLCTANSTTIVIASPNVPTLTLAASDFCYDSINAATLVVTAAGGVAPYQYHINGGVLQSSNTFPNVQPGTHTIEVVDAYGCTASITNIVVAPQLSAIAVITKDLDCSATPDAVITVTVSGGYTPFTYRVRKGAGAFSAVTPFAAPSFTYNVTAANADTYTFEITDARGCITTVTATINPITNPTATTTNVNPTCNGLTNGSVQIIPAGGSGSYTFSFNGSPFTTTSLYTGLSAGIPYPYEVRDSKGCLFIGTVTLTQPAALTETHTSTPFSCSASNTYLPATITVNGSGGTAPYEYSFLPAGFTSTNTISVNDNGTNQTINFIVRDARGCTVPGSVILSRLNPPTITTIVATPVTCTATTSSATVTATNGVGVLTYAITSPAASAASNTTGVFTGLAPGAYVFQVTDANGCYDTESFNILPVTPIAVTGLKLSDVLCNGGTTGSIQFTVSGFSTTYSYTINAGAPITGQTATIINLPNLAAGNYTIQVTDAATGCTASATIIINQPAAALAFTVTTTNVSCNNDISQIVVTASGGTPTYTYAAVVSGAPAPVTYVASNTLNVDTNSGTILNWDVYVRDANGCIRMNPVSIISDPLPTVTAPALASNQCTVSTGFTFTATGISGVAPLTFSIGGAFQSSPTFVVNAPGSYTITIRDANGCTASSATQTNVYPALNASAILTDDLNCSLPLNGTIQVTAGGGLAPYTYQVYENAVAITGQVAFAGTTVTIPVNNAANYTVLITDVNGCTRLTNVVTTTAAIPPTATFISVNPRCNAGTNGSITLNAVGGQAPYLYSIGGPFVGTNVFGGLSAGTYTYTIRDNRGCEVTGPIVLSNPAPIVVNIVRNGIVCNVNTLGSFDVTITSGGVAPFVYTLFDSSFVALATSGSTAATNYSFPNLNYGDYYINVVDANGCEFLSTRQRIETQPLLTFTAQVDSNNCATGVDVTVTTSGGAGPFVYSIFGQPGSAPTGPTFTFVGLNHGTTYTLQVQDVNNCVSILEYTTPPAPSSINITGVSQTNVTCTGAGNGTFAFTVQNYDGTVTNINYQLLNALTNLPVVPPVGGTLVGPAGGPVSGSITGLSAGNYTIRVVEATGTLCSAVYTFQITQPISLPTATIQSEVNANCNFGAQVVISATGGTAPYQYAFVPDGAPQGGAYGPSNSAILNLPTLNWDIWVIDANGCEFKIDKAIIRDADPTINPVAPQCFTGAPLNITITGTVDPAIVAPTTYSIGGTYQASPNFVINAPGTYTLSIRDGNGCIASIAYIVRPQVLLNATLTQDLTCIVDGSITIVPSGGTGVYANYEVSYNAGPFTPIPGTTYTTNLPGTYTFSVTDSQGCPAISNIITVTPRTSPTFTFTQTNVSCNGGNDGSITITPANGIAPYEYSIDNGVTYQTSNQFSGLTEAGVYTIVIRDNKGCLSPATPVDITDPDPVAGVGVLTQGLTCGAGNATQPAIVTITGSGGTSPYTFSFDGGINYTTTNTYSTNVSGTVTAYIRDVNGCIIAVPVSVIVPALNIPTDLAFNATPITCLALTSSVTLTATNGVGPLEYEILTPIAVGPQVSNVFAGLAPNTYLFQVTDVNGCTYTEFYTVLPVTNITVSGQLIDDVSCNGGANGAVQFTVSNFAGTYSYSVNAGAVIPGQNSPIINLTGLSAGNYQINITDEITGCTATTTITVAQPAAVSIVVDANINANCNFGAQVTVHGVGGTAPYTYAFVQDGAAPVPGNYSTSNTAVLDATINTSWDVHVLDANNCPAQIDVIIATDPLPSGITATVTSQCPSPTGTYDFTVNVTTGIAPYEYNIGTGFQTNPLFTVNAPGTYTITVRDANGCTNPVPVTVTILPALQLQAQITAIPTCNNPDGEVTLTASGGSVVPSYLFSADGVTYGASNVFNGLAPGTYTFYVRDTGTTCVDTVTITIEPATIITGFNATPTPVTCNGASDGTITVVLAAPSSGVNDNPIYTYQLNAGIPQTSSVFSGLIAGSYTIQVNSGRGCIATQIVVVNEPAVITVPAPTVAQFACTAGSNATNFATITVTGVTGGSGVYTNYEFILGGVTVQSGASNVFTATNTNGGTYTVNVYDANGCIGTTTAIINPFIGILNPVVTVTTPVTCTSTESIAVTVTTTGIAPVLTYTINSIPGGSIAGFPQTNNTGIFNGLVIGDYLITVTNPITNCSVEIIHYVFNPNTFTLNVTPVSDVICVGGTDGSVSLTIVDNDLTPTNDAGPFSYIIQNINTGLTINGNSATAGPTPPITGLTAGVYTVTVTLTNIPTCPVTSGFTILEPSAPLNVTATNTAITCIPGTDGSITATATGGWGGPYEFELVGPVNVPYSTNNVFTGLGAGNYTVNVRDVKLCVDSFAVTLSIPAPIAATVTPSTALVPCFGDASASIFITYPTGGQGSNYTYVLNTILPIPTNSGPINIPLAGELITGLGAGTYSVTIQDGFGCIFQSGNITIGEPGKLVATLSTTVDETCNADTVITLTATGGTPPFTYSSDNVTYSVATFNPSVNINIPVGSTGTFAYYIKDANNCVSEISNPITNVPPDPVVITVVNQTDILCGGPTGALSVTAVGGLGNYVYTLVDAIGTPIVAGSQVLPGQFTNLPAATYYVLVTTNGGCNATAGPFVFTNPPVLVISAPVITPVKCASGSDGTISFTLSGGVTPFYYAISPQLDQFFPITGNTVTIQNLVIGNYTVLFQDGNGCFTQINNLIISEPPALSTGIAVTTDVTCTELADGTITIPNIAGGTPPYFATLNYVTHYDNNFNPPLLVDDSVYVPVIGNTHTFIGLAGGTYPIAIKDTNGCVILDVIDVDPGVLYTPAIRADIRCNDVGGVSTQYVELTAVNTNNLPSGAFPANGGFLFSLDVNDVNVAQLSPTFNSINFPSLLTPGTHIIYVFSASDCNKASTPYIINASDIDPLVLVLEQGGLNEIIANTNNALGQPSGTPPYTFTFNGYNNGSDNSYVYTQSGNYHVTVTDSKGCFAEATQPFTFVPIFIPNVFTPDGNGGNDLWGPTNTANYKDLTTDIFDRYGRKVKELKEGEFWDGKYNGNELPSGDYWYVIKVDGNNDKEYVGHFTLYR